MKLTVDDAVADVVFNPANKNDGRPDAGMTYMASLRADSTTGGARLTVGTDFTPPCVLAVLPRWSTSLAYSVLALLGFYAPSRDRWMIGRPDVYAFADGVEYVEPADEELAFMAAFGFTPGARFNLALPMLRAQRAQWLSGDVVRTQPDEVAPEELAAAAKADAAMTVDEVDAAQRALEYPNVSGGGVPESPVAAPVTPLDTHADPAKRAAPVRRRRAVKPVGKVEIVSQVLGTPTEESFVNPAAVDPIPASVSMLDDEDNPFAIGGV
jgi:hypothetical protein